MPEGSVRNKESLSNLITYIFHLLKTMGKGNYVTFEIADSVK